MAPPQAGLVNCSLCSARLPALLATLPGSFDWMSAAAERFVQQVRSCETRRVEDEPDGGETAAGRNPFPE